MENIGRTSYLWNCQWKVKVSYNFFPRVFLTYIAAPMSASIVRPGMTRDRSSLFRVQWFCYNCTPAGKSLDHITRRVTTSANTTVQFKRRTIHAPIQMQISFNKGFCSLTLDSEHENFDVWTRPMAATSINAQLSWCSLLFITLYFA